MNEADRCTEARRWIHYAEEDLKAAEGVPRSGGVPRHACWLAQQAAEKALKAVLVFQQIDFPRSHDLDALRNLIPEGWAVKTRAPDLAELTEWAVESRYPGDWPDATTAEAAAAVTQARGVVDCICADFAEQGYVTDEGK